MDAEEVAPFKGEKGPRYLRGADYYRVPARKVQ